MVAQVESLYQTYFRNEAVKAASPLVLLQQPISILWISQTRSDPRFAKELYIASLVCPSCHQRQCNNPFCKGE